MDNDRVLVGGGNAGEEEVVADDLRGVFVETAWRNDEVELSIVEDQRLGLKEGECQFLVWKIS